MFFCFEMKLVETSGALESAWEIKPALYIVIDSCFRCFVILSCDSDDN